MLALSLPANRKLTVLCIGAHSDDLEIGCGGTLMQLLRERRGVELTWVVMSAIGQRASEARASVRSLAAGAKRLDIRLNGFQDGFLPAQFREAKECFEQLKRDVAPDVIFTHTRLDRHQDHRLVCELTWNTWRDHLVLEYEIPKYEGDLGQPNLYMPLSKAVVDRKLRVLNRYFGTQRSKQWFSDDTFRGLMRIRGIECKAPSGFAEAFHATKISIQL